MKKNQILRIYGTQYKNMTRQLLEEASLAEDISVRTEGKSNPLIGIKPNLVSPTPASFGATTHPEIIAGITEYLQEHGFTNLMICEGSWVGDKTEEAFKWCGYRELEQQYHIPLFDTQKDSSFSAEYHGRTLHLCSCVKDIDYLINVPVLKGHCQTRVTCALKNLKGLIPNSEKRRFHALGLHKPIADLNGCIRQDFIVVDHICGDPDFEDGGSPMVTNCIMAAGDPVLTDAWACRILGFNPEEVEYIRLAAESGIGCADLSTLELVTLGPSDSASRSEPVSPVSLTHRSLALNYATEEVESCSACYSALTGALNRLHEDGLLKMLTDSLHVKFCIGQGYRRLSHPAEEKGRNISSQNHTPAAGTVYIGIGSCTGAFEKNIPGCPPSEDNICRFLISYLNNYSSE